MELCGGTHTAPRARSACSALSVKPPSPPASAASKPSRAWKPYKQANEQLHLIKSVAGKVNAPVAELEKKIESLLTQQKELEKQLKSAQQKQAADTARTLVGKAQIIGSTPAIIENIGTASGDSLQSIADSRKASLRASLSLRAF